MVKTALFGKKEEPAEALPVHAPTAEVVPSGPNNNGIPATRREHVVPITVEDRLQACFLQANPTKIAEIPAIIDKMAVLGVTQVQLFAKLAARYQVQRVATISKYFHISLVEAELRGWLLEATKRTPDMHKRIRENEDARESLLSLLRDGSILCHLCRLDYRDTRYVQATESNAGGGSPSTAASPTNRQAIVIASPPGSNSNSRSHFDPHDSTSARGTPRQPGNQSVAGSGSDGSPQMLHAGRSHFYATENIERFLRFCTEDLGWGPGFFTVEGLQTLSEEELILHRLMWLSLRLWETGICDAQPPLCAVYDVSCWKGVEGRPIKEMFPVPPETKPVALHIGEVLDAVKIGVRVDMRSDNYLQIWHPVEHPMPVELPCCVLQDYLCVKAGTYWQLAGAVVGSYARSWSNVVWQFPCYEVSQHVKEARKDELGAAGEASAMRSPSRVPAAQAMAMEVAAAEADPTFIRMPTPPSSHSPNDSKTISLVPSMGISNQNPPSHINTNATSHQPEYTPCSSMAIPEITRESSWGAFFAESFTSERFDVTFIHASLVTDSLCRRLANPRSPPASTGTGGSDSTPESPLTPQTLKAQSSMHHESLTVRVVPEAPRSLLGRGSFGTVFLGLDLNTGKSVALKIIALSSSASATRNVEREVQHICRIEHPHIVRCFGVSLTETNCLCIAMEFAAAGTLLELLRRFSPIPLQLAYRYICGIADGLEYLHSERIIHCDLKPQNILVRGDGSVAISDFGCSQSVATVAIVQAEAGTLAYMSPECVQSRSFSKPSDVWAFGCCVAELCTGLAPWNKYPEWEQVMYRLGATNELPYDDDQLACIGDEVLIQVIRQCLDRDPDARPTMVDVLNTVRQGML